MNAENDLLKVVSEILGEVKAIDANTQKLVSLIGKSQNKQDETKPEKTYTFEDIRGILAKKSTDGYREEVKALITKFGGNRLSDIKQEDYAEFIRQAEGIGNE